MLVYFLREQGIDIRGADHIKRSLFAKQSIEEWANRMAAVLNGRRREAAVLLP
jgi:hypothetical protein